MMTEAPYAPIQKLPYQNDIVRETLRALNRPGRARTDHADGDEQVPLQSRRAVGVQHPAQQHVPLAGQARDRAVTADRADVFGQVLRSTHAAGVTPAKGAAGQVKRNIHTAGPRNWANSRPPKSRLLLARKNIKHFGEQGSFSVWLGTRQGEIEGNNVLAEGYQGTTLAL